MVSYVSFSFLIIIERHIEIGAFIYVLDITVVFLLKYLLLSFHHVWQIHIYYTFYSSVSPFHSYKDKRNNY